MKKNILLLFLALADFGILSGQTPSAWLPKGMGGGGAVYSPSISPFDGNEVYLGCDMGLMSHSLDFGNTWRTIHFDTLMGQRHTKVNFTNHPDTLYVEYLDKYSSKMYPAISVNHGATWSVIPNTAYWGTYGSFRLFANPNDSRQVIASSYAGVYFSGNWGGAVSQIHSAAAQGSAFVHLAGVVYTDDTIFVSTDKGLIISPDKGASWNTFVNYNTMGIVTGAGFEGVVSFEGAVTNNQIRFFCTTISAGNLGVKTEPRDIQYFQKLYRLNYNSATTWTDITPNLKNADGTLNNFNYAYQVAMNRNNIDTLYLTGQTRSPATATGSRFGTVYKTTDGGNTFSNMFLKNSNSTNSAISTGWMGGANTTQWKSTWVSINTTEGLCVDPGNVSRIMRSDFTMVCASYDGGATWDQRYVNFTEHPPLTLIDKNDLYQTNGLQTTVCHWLEWLSPSRMLVAYSDLLMNESNDSGSTWGFLFDSLWSQRVNDIPMFCRSASGRLYAPEGETLGNNGDWSDYRLSITHAGKIMYSDDAMHWHLLKTFNAPVSWAAFDANDTTTLYVTVLSELADTVGGIWKCTGLPNTPVWTKLISPARTQRRPSQIFSLNNGDLVVVYGARDSSTVQPISFSFQASAGVFLSSDGGNTWTDLCAAWPGMQKDVRFLTIDPSDPAQDTWLLGVGVSGTGSQKGLYRTVNRGASWTNVYANTLVLSCTFNPASPTEMYVCSATDGLFYATGANTNSPAFTAVASYPFRAPERVFFNPYNMNEVWVVSWGNGLRMGTTLITDVPLPVDLVSFTGWHNSQTNQSELHWTTQSETNCDHFDIECSHGISPFIFLLRVDGYGNSSVPIDYTAYDTNPSPGKNYYRLKQTDYDGSSHYSSVIEISGEGKKPSLLIYPVPASGYVLIRYPSPSGEFRLTIIDGQGCDVTGSASVRKMDDGNLQADISALSGGVYKISLSDEVGVTIGSMTVVR